MNIFKKIGNFFANIFKKIGGFFSNIFKKPKNKRIFFYTLFGIFSAIFVVSAIFLIDYFLESAKMKKRYGELADTKNQTQAIVQSIPTTPAGKPDYDPEVEYPFDTTSPILPEYQDAYEQNDDLIGWIRIDGTVIDYPVVQRMEDEDFYLNHNFDGESSKHGCIYLRSKFNPFKPSDNVVIYGHYKQDGTMFHDLHGYYRESFWKEHQFIEFDTIYEHHTYQILAVFKVNVDDKGFFPYHKFNNAETAEEFNNYVNTVKSMSFYDTGVNAEYGDKLITLSTCEYTLSDGRLVVVAKRVS